MASIRREIGIDCGPGDVWSALRDVGALHTRLAPGFVVDTVLDGDTRIVTFGNGTVVRELIVDVDDAARRVAWSVVEGRFRHHHASAQVFVGDESATRFVWIADLLPDDRAPTVAAMMDAGLLVIKQTMERRATPARA